MRLYRRVIEIRDAQWLLTGRAGDGAEDAAALRAAITTGKRLEQAASPTPDAAHGPPGASQSAGGPDVDAEVRALLGLARRYRDAAVQGVVATPVALAGHNDPPNPNG